jgi:formylglycine-generating enzyme required for sulfatase activity
VRDSSSARVRVATALAVLVGSGVVACSIALDFSGIDDGARDASSDGTSLHDASSDGAPSSDAPAPPPTDGGTDVVTPPGDATPDVLDARPEGACPGNEGPQAVSIGAFCVDSTEVTNDQYTRFLAAKAGDTSGQPSTCTVWNTSFIPAGWPPAPDAGAFPVVGVNWCMAYMYCAWTGKRMCGAPDGGAADPNAWDDPTKSQWFKACSRNNDGLHIYPYGDTYNPGACNGADHDTGAPLPSLTTCTGGYPGLFDMSGNVLEWEDSCGPPGGDAGDQNGETDFCHTRGGSFRYPAANLRCDDGEMYTRGSPPNEVGIRCCGP